MSDLLPMCECATEYEGDYHHPQCPVRRRMETDAERITALEAALRRYRNEVPLGHQPHMFAAVVDDLLGVESE